MSKEVKDIEVVDPQVVEAGKFEVPQSADMTNYKNIPYNKSMEGVDFPYRNWFPNRSERRRLIREHRKNNR
jgi:hypothetical protein